MPTKKIDETTPPTAGLVAAVNAVMLEVPAVPKTGENQFHHYRYASDFDLMSAVQPAMARHGLMLVPVTMTSTTIDTGKGKQNFRTDVLGTYRLQHISGEHIDIQMPGSGVDDGDKGVYKALTGALKYVLTQVFCLPRGDDPEKDEQPERHPPPAAKPAKQPSAVADALAEGQPLPDILTAHELRDEIRLAMRRGWTVPQVAQLLAGYSATKADEVFQSKRREVAVRLRKAPPASADLEGETEAEEEARRF